MQPDAKAAHRRKCKAYHVRRHQMGGSTTVPTDEAREILTELAQRMSLSAIGRAIGTSHGYVSKIISGEIKRTSPERAAKIRSIRNHWPADTSHVSPVGARRRLQALHALGYPWARLAREIDGYSLTAIKQLVKGETPVIEAQHDRLIRATYARLSMVLPTSADPHEASGIGRARNAAKKHGWPPPLAWDDIDTDPEPHTPADIPVQLSQHLIDHAVVQRVADGQQKPRKLTNAEAAEVVRILRSRGLTDYQIEARGFRPSRYGRGAA